MPLADKVQQLDQQIASAVKNTLAGLRQELNERLRQSTETIRERLEGLDVVLPASFVGDRDLEPIAAEAAAGARSQTLSDLGRAVSALDRATSQAAILATLLEQSCAYASRAALFLTPVEAARGWRGEGFGDAGATLAELVIPYSEGTAWGALAQGGGTVALNTADCADLASRLETPVPREAVLVPLVLADRVAAALYADRFGDGVLEVPALQVLVHLAAQAIELLPLRSRTATPTLRSHGAAEAEGVGLPLWTAPIGAPAAVAEPEAQVPEAQPLEAAIEAEAAATEPPLWAEPESLVEPETWSQPPGWEMPVAEPDAPAVAEIFEEEEAFEGDETAVHAAPEPSLPVEVEESAAPFVTEIESFAVVEEVVPEALPEPLAIASWEETAAELFPAMPMEDQEAPAVDLASPAATATLPAFTSEAAFTPEEPEPLSWPEPESATAAMEVPEEYELPAIGDLAAAGPEEAVAPATASFAEGFGMETPAAGGYDPATFEPPAFDEPAFEAPLPATPPPSSLEPATAALDMPDFDGANDETLLLSRQAATVAIPVTPPAAPRFEPTPRREPEEEPEEEATHPGRAPFATTRFSPPPAEAPRPQATAGGAEVRPPSGFEGPGLAFAPGPRAVPGVGETAAHEEARRLARLLVSEIRLYNEEQVEEGRRNRDIYFRLRDEIDRSRKMYNERIAPDVRAANDYFTEELIRRLADGDPDALGM